MPYIPRLREQAGGLHWDAILQRNERRRVDGWNREAADVHTRARVAAAAAIGVAY